MDLFSGLPEPYKPQPQQPQQTSEYSGNAASVGTSVKRKADELNQYEQQAIKKAVPDVNFELRSYVKERKGERDDMQDAHVMCDNLEQHIPTLDPSINRVMFFGVFDGHGGSRASKYTAEHLHLNIAAKFPKGNMAAVEKEMRKSLIEAFKKTDDDFLREATKTKPSWKDGTTVVGVLVVNDVMYITNLGDSKAVLARISDKNQTAVAMPLTTDHTPTQYEERMRIQKSGGHVREGRVMGILEVSRSIGDGQFKSHGLSCVPDIRRCQITMKDKFLILACDGVWKVFSSNEVVSFVLDKLMATNVESENARFESACTKLANEAIRRGCGDNITVLIISINRCN